MFNLSTNMSDIGLMICEIDFELRHFRKRKLIFLGKPYGRVLSIKSVINVKLNAFNQGFGLCGYKINGQCTV